MAKKPAANKGPTGRPATVHPTKRPAAKVPERPAPAPAKKAAPANRAPPQRAAPAQPDRTPPAQARATGAQPLRRPGTTAQPLQRPSSAPAREAPARDAPADRWSEIPPQGEQAELAVTAEQPAQPSNSQRAMDAPRGVPQRTASRVVVGASRAVVVRGNGGLPVKSFSEATGFETMDSEDLLIPRMVILQDLSPQVKPNRSEYIDGAVPGMIYNTATGALLGPWNTDEEWNNNPPLVVIPVYFERRGLEWLPDRQGLVRDWGRDESYRRQFVKEGMMWITPEGNRIQPTLTYYCLNLSENDLRCFIPMSSVFAKHGKKWNSVMNAYKIPETGGDGKLWSRGWQLRTVPQQNDQGDWMGWQIDPDFTFEEYPEETQKSVESFYYTMAGGAGAATSQFVADYEDSQGIADNAGVNAAEM